MNRLELIKKIYGDVPFKEKQLIQLFDLIDLAREQERARCQSEEQERAKQLRDRSTYF